MPALLDRTPRIQEHGARIYITTPVQLWAPSDAEVQAFVFGSDVRKSAPNDNLLWLRGQYVEADAPNANSDQWTAGELAIKSLTPVLMPITIMHDLRSAVGVIADAKLVTPEADGVPRARIDTALAVWSHRFPEAAAEAKINAEQGTLMQSMECISAYYDCSICGVMMQRGANWQQEWAEHSGSHAPTVAADGRKPARILANVTFTGVGLIFGTRGARGAYRDAHLQVEELAAMHQEAHAGTVSNKRTGRKNQMDIDDSKYQELVARSVAATAAEAKVTELTTTIADKDKAIEKLEADKLSAEEKATKAETEANDAKEAVRVAAMRDERIAALGTAFKAKLDKLETTRKLVATQAGKMTDEEWTARLAELSETLAVKHDANETPADDKDDKGGKGGGGGDTLAGTGDIFSRREVAGSVAGGVGEVTAGDTGTAPSPASRQSVVGGLIKRPTKRTPAKA